MKRVIILFHIHNEHLHTLAITIFPMN